MRSYPATLLALACASIFLAGCKKAAPPPPPPRVLSIQVNSSAAPVGEVTGRIVVAPYPAARERLFEAMLKRRKNEERLRAELKELEETINKGPVAAIASASGHSEALQDAIASARQTLEVTADRALIYYEEVAAGPGKELPAEQLNAFREKLSVDRLRQFGAQLSQRDPDLAREAIEKSREILNGTVYSGEGVKKEAARARAALDQLEKGFAASTPAAQAAERPASASGTDSLNGGNLLMRVANNRATIMQITDPMVVFNALPRSEYTAETDSQGKATVTIPPTGRWVIGVCFQRPARDIISLNFGISDTFCWVQEVGTPNQINLTSDNRLSPAVAPLGLEQDIPWR